MSDIPLRPCSRLACVMAARSSGRRCSSGDRRRTLPPMILGKLGRLSSGAYVLVGVLVGGLLAPAAVYATSTIVNIAGPSGRKAEVSTANQLQVAESSPAAYFESGYPQATTAHCTVIATPPSGKALVVTQLSVEMQALPSFDS